MREVIILSDNQLLGRADTASGAMLQALHFSDSRVTVETTDDGSLEAFLECPIFVNKKIFLGSWSDEFTKFEVVADCVRPVCAKFGWQLMTMNPA